MKISPMGKSLPFPKDLHFGGGAFYHENLVPVPSPDSIPRPAYLGSPLRETLHILSLPPLEASCLGGDIQ